MNNDYEVNELYNSIEISYWSSIYKKTIKIKRKSKPWFNGYLYYLITQRDFYFKRKKIYPNNNFIRKAYDSYNKLVKQNIKNTKKAYFKNSFENLNNRNIWKVINFAIYNKN